MVLFIYFTISDCVSISEWKESTRFKPFVEKRLDLVQIPVFLSFLWKKKIISLIFGIRFIQKYISINTYFVRCNTRTLITYYYWSVPSQESKRSCIFVLEVSILPLSMLLVFDFRTVPAVRYFLFFFSGLQSSNIDHLWFMNFLVVVELIVCRWWCSFWWCARFYCSCQCYFYSKNIRTKL